MKNHNIIDDSRFLICRQSLEEMKELYECYFYRHFPADERKPFHYIEKWFREGREVENPDELDGFADAERKPIMLFMRTYRNRWLYSKVNSCIYR